MDNVQRSKIAWVLRGMADALTDPNKKPTMRVDGGEYENGVDFAIGFMTDYHTTNLSLGDYLDTALEELGLEKPQE